MNDMRRVIHSASRIWNDWPGVVVDGRSGHDGINARGILRGHNSEKDLRCLY